MDNEIESKWKLFCIGKVTENKPLSTNNIRWAPIELTPMVQGDMVPRTEVLTASSVDRKGNPIEAKSLTDNSSEAEWLPDDGNRLTAPDVVRDEEVFIYRYANTNRYFWKEKPDPEKRKLRRGETVRWGTSGNINQVGDSNGEVNPDNYYLFEMSGHAGAITLSTSAANGEVSKYKFILNGKGGAITIADDDGQEIFLNTKEEVVHLKNKSGSFVRVEKKNVLSYAVEDYIIKAERDIGISAGRHFTIVAGQNYTQTAGLMTTITSGKEINQTAPDIKLNGVIHLNGPIVQDAGAAGGYEAKMFGPLNVDKDVTAGKVSLMEHPHKPNGEGKLTDPPTPTK